MVNAKRNARIIALRKAGVGPREIARQLSLSPGVVAGALHRAGLCKLERGRGFGATEEIKRLVLRTYADGSAGLTFKDVGCQFGLAAQTVHAWWLAA